MSEREKDHEANPDPGHPHGETLPDASPATGEAARETGDEWGAKAAKSGAKRDENKQGEDT